MCQHVGDEMCQHGGDEMCQHDGVSAPARMHPSDHMSTPLQYLSHLLTSHARGVRTHAQCQSYTRAKIAEYRVVSW
jgi:hypothetical protein